jgi:hypothetical protein
VHIQYLIAVAQLIAFIVRREYVLHQSYWLFIAQTGRQFYLALSQRLEA